MFDSFAFAANFRYSEIREPYMLSVRKNLMPIFVAPYGGEILRVFLDLYKHRNPLRILKKVRQAHLCCLRRGGW